MSKQFIKLWGKPLLMGIFCLFGLITALVADGFWDYLACAVLAIPLYTFFRKYYFSEAKRVL